MTTKKFSRTRVDLQERDLDILETIAELRFATVPQITKLFPSTEIKIINPKGEFRQGAKAIANRLSKMAQRKHYYIRRVGYPHRLGSEPSVYTLEGKGVRALARHRGYDFPELFEQVAYIQKYFTPPSNKVLFLEHRLGINNFRVTLTLALRKHPTAGWHFADDKTPYWLEPRPVRVQNKILEQPIEATVNGRVMGRIPDALFILKPETDKRHTIAYIYEKDRGTEKHETVYKKLQCYHWHQQKKHHKMLGTKSLRVLIETENPDFFDFARVLSHLSQLPTLYSNIVLYISFIFGLELILRIFDLIFRAVGLHDEKNEEDDENKEEKDK